MLEAIEKFLGAPDKEEARYQSQNLNLKSVRSNSNSFAGKLPGTETVEPRADMAPRQSKSKE